MALECYALSTDGWGEHSSVSCMIRGALTPVSSGGPSPIFSSGESIVLEGVGYVEERAYPFEMTTDVK